MSDETIIPEPAVITIPPSEPKFDQIVVRFKVDSAMKGGHVDGPHETIRLSAVNSDEEHTPFATVTPIGNFSLRITDPDAHGFFVSGFEYLLYIKRA